MKDKLVFFIFVGGFLIISESAFAQSALTTGVLDSIALEFKRAALAWLPRIKSAAMWLFWTLGAISLTWTGVTMALRKADLQEFFAEFTRFCLFFGFFLWLLRNGPNFALSIIISMQQIGQEASGVSGTTPSNIVDVGWDILLTILKALSVLDPIKSLVIVTIGFAVFITVSLIAINMLILFINTWIMMYVGVFFLGFGGSRWTSEIAIGYYRTVLGLSVQLFTMILLVGIGNNIITDLASKIKPGEPQITDITIILISSLLLYITTSRIPAMLGGMVSGGNASGGAGSVTAGSIIGGGMALAGAGVAAGFGAAGLAKMAGAAAQTAASNVAGGSDVLSRIMGASSNSSSGAGATSGVRLSSPSSPSSRSSAAPASAFSGSSGGGASSNSSGASRSYASSTPSSSSSGSGMPNSESQGAASSGPGSTASGVGSNSSGDSPSASAPSPSVEGSATPSAAAPSPSVGGSATPSAAAGPGSTVSGAGSNSSRDSLSASAPFSSAGGGATPSAAAGPGSTASSGGSGGAENKAKPVQSSMATSGKVAADFLAVVTGQMAERARTMAATRLSQTYGSQMAEKIRAAAEASSASEQPSFENDSLSGQAPSSGPDKPTE